MASPQSPGSEAPGNFRFEFDPVNRILMIRFEGHITQGLVEEFYREGKKYWIATDARAASISSRRSSCARPSAHAMSDKR